MSKVCVCPGGVFKGVQMDTPWTQRHTPMDRQKPEKNITKLRLRAVKITSRCRNSSKMGENKICTQTTPVTLFADFLHDLGCLCSQHVFVKKINLVQSSTEWNG